MFAASTKSQSVMGASHQPAFIDSCLSINHMRLSCLATISFIIFWQFLIFCQIFLSPQVKRWPIITYKHCIYELPHGLLNVLRLRILRNEEILGKYPNPIEWYPSAQSPRQNETFVNTSRKLLKNRNDTFPVMRYFTWKPEFVSNPLSYRLWKAFFDSNSPQTPPNLISLTLLKLFHTALT